MNEFPKINLNGGNESHFNNAIVYYYEIPMECKILDTQHHQKYI